MSPLDTAPLFDSQGTPQSEFIQSYTLVIDGNYKALDPTKLGSLSSIKYEPDFPEVKYPFYFMEGSKRRFYLLTNVVTEPSILKSVYDIDQF